MMLGTKINRTQELIMGMDQGHLKGRYVIFLNDFNEPDYIVEVVLPLGTSFTTAEAVYRRYAEELQNPDTRIAA